MGSSDDACSLTATADNQLSVQTRWGVGKRPGNPFDRKVVEEVCQIPGSTIDVYFNPGGVRRTSTRGYEVQANESATAIERRHESGECRSAKATKRRVDHRSTNLAP